MFPYLEKHNFSNKYYFYTALDGLSGYLESSGEELLSIKGGNGENTLKLQTSVPIDTELWYDKDTGILLRKIEHYNKNYVLRYEVMLDSLRE